MTAFRKFAVAGALALAIGSAMTGIASARGGGGGGGGGGGAGGDAGLFVDTAPITTAAGRGGRGQTSPAAARETTVCHVDVYRNTTCERVRAFR